MRSMLMAFAVLVLAAGSGHAEEPAPAQPPPPDARMEPPPMHGPRDFHGRRGFRDAERPPPPPSRAARFRIERGDLKLDVRCAEEETMRACADIVLQLLDKAGQD
jgi:hypothetical protein